MEGAQDNETKEEKMKGSANKDGAKGSQGHEEIEVVNRTVNILSPGQDTETPNKAANEIIFSVLMDVKEGMLRVEEDRKNGNTKYFILSYLIYF